MYTKTTIYTIIPLLCKLHAKRFHPTKVSILSHPRKSFPRTQNLSQGATVVQVDEQILIEVTEVHLGFFAWAVVTGVLASIIAHYVCKAMDRCLGSKKN